MQNLIENKISQLLEEQEVYHKQNLFLDSIPIMEDAFDMIRELYGENSQQFIKQGEKLSEMYNLIAKDFIEYDESQEVIKYLKKAENLYQYKTIKKYYISTLSGLSLYYKKAGKLRTSLSYLQKGLYQFLQNQDQSNLVSQEISDISEIYNNLSAVYSDYGKHQESQQCASFSIIYRQNQIIKFYQDIVKQQSKELEENLKKEIENTNKKLNNEFKKLVISYYNLGSQLEFKKDYFESKSIYQIGLEIAKKQTIPEQNLILNFNKALDTLKNQINKENQIRHQRILKNSSLQNQFQMPKSTLPYNTPIQFPNQQQANENFYNLNRNNIINSAYQVKRPTRGNQRSISLASGQLTSNSQFFISKKINNIKARPESHHSQNKLQQKMKQQMMNKSDINFNYLMNQYQTPNQQKRNSFINNDNQQIKNSNKNLNNSKQNQNKQDFDYVNYQEIFNQTSQQQYYKEQDIKRNKNFIENYSNQNNVNNQSTIQQQNSQYIDSDHEINKIGQGKNIIQANKREQNTEQVLQQQQNQNNEDLNNVNNKKKSNSHQLLKKTNNENIQQKSEKKKCENKKILVNQLQLDQINLKNINSSLS